MRGARERYLPSGPLIDTILYTSVLTTRSLHTPLRNILFVPLPNIPPNQYNPKIRPVSRYSTSLSPANISTLPLVTPFSNNLQNIKHSSSFPSLLLSSYIPPNNTELNHLKQLDRLDHLQRCWKTLIGKYNYGLRGIMIRLCGLWLMPSWLFWLGFRLAL